jgi:heptosyltransferase-2
MVMAQSLFIALKRRNPDCEISVLAPAWTRPLLDRMPEVDHSLALPFGHGDLKLLARRSFGRDLREHRFTQAIVLPNSLKSALIPFFANIPLRTGWRGEMRGGLLNDCRRLNKTNLPLMVERFAALAKPPTDYPEKRAASPRLLVSREQVDAALDKFSLQAAANTGRLVALCPGAEFGPSKQWPAQNFARAATDLILLGWHVVIMGSKGDAEVAQEIEQGIATKVGEKLRSRVSNLGGQDRPRRGNRHSGGLFFGGEQRFRPNAYSRRARPACSRAIRLDFTGFYAAARTFNANTGLGY